MLKIKLMRIGKTGEPHYRIVISEAKSKNAGKYVEQIGYYNTQTKPSTVKLDAERAKYWIDQGAQPTETVSYILVKEKVIEAKPYKEPKKSTKKESKKVSKKVEAKEEKTDTDVKAE